jgi:hypothetical protein
MEEEACIVVVASGGGRQTRGSGSVKVEETVFGLLGLVYTGPEQGGRSKNNKLQYFFFFSLQSEQSNVTFHIIESKIPLTSTLLKQTNASMLKNSTWVFCAIMKPQYLEKEKNMLTLETTELYTD